MADTDKPENQDGIIPQGSEIIAARDLEETRKIDPAELDRLTTRATTDLNLSRTSRSLTVIFSKTYRTIVQGFSTTKVIDLGDSTVSEDEPINPETSDSEALNEDLDYLEDSIDIMDEIAKGGQGRISRAFDKKFGRTIAVKSIHDDIKDRLEHRKSFITEAKVTAQLDHPAIVPVYGLFEDGDNGLHLSMKLIRGKTLKEYLERTCNHYHQMSRFECQRFEHNMLVKRLDIFLRVCEAISYVHHRQVVHRDLKPENIMIGSFHETYVMDWGIAEYHGEGKQDSPSKLAGTLQYIAPEVINKKPYDTRSDIFLLGLVLFEIVFLKQAYAPAKTREEAVMKARSCKLEPFEHRFKARVSRDLKRIIGKALAPDPDRRYQTTKELENDIRNFEMGEAISAHPDGVIDKFLRKLRHHYKFMLSFTAIMMLLFFTVMSLMLFREYNHRSNNQRRDVVLAEIYSRGIYSCSLFDSRFQNYENLISSIANEASLLLTTRPKDIDLNIFIYSEGLEKGAVPADFIYSPIYRKPNSLAEIVYILPPGTDRSKLQIFMPYIRQLYPLRRGLRTAIYTSLRDILPEDTPQDQYNDIIRNKVKPPLLVAYVGFRNGLHMGFPYELDYGDDYDPRTRGWYHDAIKSPDRAVWGAPYVDIGEVKDIVLTCSKVIFDQNHEVLGVAAGDISLAQLLKMLEENGNSGSFIKNKYLIDGKGRIIADSELDMGSFRTGDDLHFKNFHSTELLATMWQMKNGWVPSVENGVTYLYFFYEIRSLRWLYIERIDFAELLRSH